MQLKQIARILVTFSPWTGSARSAREFVKQMTSDAARASNPDCKVETKVMVKSDPFIEIEYENKSVERIDTSKLTVAQILELVQSKAEEMDTAAKLEKAGLHDQRLDSSWMKELGKEKELGKIQFIPRQN